MSLPDFSVKRPITILMVFLAVLVIGWASLGHLPVELLPNVSMSDISIIIRVRGGMPPESVENLVTRPVEEAVSTVSHLQNIVSTTKKGESRVVLQFEPGTNIDFVALEVREKFSTVEEKLPPEIEKPVIAQYKQSDHPIVLVAVTADNYSPTYLRRLVDEQIKEQILRVEGVANIDVYGGRARKILVEVDQDRLQAFGLSIQSVISVLGRNNLNLLAGELDRRKNKFLVRTIGIFNSLEEIENITVATTSEGSSVVVKDVAKVADSYLEPESYARVDVQPVVSLYIFKESTANTVEVAHGVEATIEQIQSELPQGVLIRSIHNQAKSIEEAIDTVKNALLWGGILAICVLLVFLRELRSTFIIGVTIPISVMATFSLMYIARAVFHQELSLNIMTLSGLALGIGMLVDNSIVVLENIAKKRNLNISSIRSAISGTSEVLLAIAASTVTTVIVFLPFVFVNKEIQLTWSGLALTVTFSLIASLFVATSLVPMLSSRLGAGPRLFSKRRPKKAVTSSARKSIYRYLVGYFLRYRYVLCINILILFFIAAYMCMHIINREFMAQSGEGRFTIYVDLDPGANLKSSNYMVKEVEAFLETVPEIANFSSQIEPASSRVHVRLVPLAHRTKSTKDLIEEIRSNITPIEKHYKGGFIYFSEIQDSGFEEITLDLFGHNYDTLKTLAGEVATRISSIPGLTDIRMSRIEGRPEWGIKLNKNKLSLLGLDVQQVSEVLHAQMRGLRATYYHTESKEIELVVRLQKKYRMSLDDLRLLTVVTPNNQQIYIKDIATFVPKLVPGTVFRKNKSRLMSVTATSTELSLDKVVEQVRQVLKDMEFPKDYFYRVGGDYYRNVENQRQLIFVLAITILLVFMVLASLFESYYQPFLIMISVPMAVIGVAAGLHITGKPIGKGVLVGAIMLAGIVVNNSIVLVDRINLLRKRGTETFDAVITGAEDRVRPIFMTTLTTVLGLLPMAVDQSESANLWSPLAITVIGGLLSSTLLTLFVIPSFYMISEDIRLIPKRSYTLFRRLIRKPI